MSVLLNAMNLVNAILGEEKRDELLTFLKMKNLIGEFKNR